MGLSGFERVLEGSVEQVVQIADLLGLSGFKWVPMGLSRFERV